MRVVIADDSVLLREGLARLLTEAGIETCAFAGDAVELDALSDREREVLALMAEGRSNAAIGRRLVIDAKTVESHIGSILTKLGLLPQPDDHRRVLAVVAWLQQT